jgi:sigma-B regulation protein RsbU (phosphoserine phosphatase)
VRADGKVETLSQGGMVLGIFPDNVYHQAAIAVASGDRLVFYTDGITEALGADGEEYGEERLTAAALASRAQPVEAMKDALMADVQAFTGGTFGDDATLIVVGL